MVNRNVQTQMFEQNDDYKDESTLITQIPQLSKSEDKETQRNTKHVAKLYTKSFLHHVHSHTG